jgi:hypothetical protein
VYNVADKGLAVLGRRSGLLGPDQAPATASMTGGLVQDIQVTLHRIIFSISLVVNRKELRGSLLGFLCLKEMYVSFCIHFE